jgi:hypothetical protein
VPGNECYELSYLIIDTPKYVGNNTTKYGVPTRSTPGGVVVPSPNQNFGGIEGRINH